MQQNLTDAQKAILEFIEKATEENGAPPSYREIQEHFGYKAVGTVQDHIKALIQKGALEKASGENRRARGLVSLQRKVTNAKRVEIYGEIAAGSPRDSQSVSLGSLVIDEALSRKPSFALRVVGDSMIEVGIFEGDLLIIEKNHAVKNGDIIAALVDGETTVKRYVEKEAAIYLVPENKRLKPLRITKQQFEIQGKVVGLQRKI